MSNDQTSKQYDVIIAGGGVSGVLAAARLAYARPDLTIAILEREASLGGRLRAAVAGERSIGYGLNGISDALFEYWAQTLKQDPDGPDLATLLPRRQQSAGILAGGRIAPFPVDAWFTAKGARALAGMTAQKQWPEVEEILKKAPPKVSEASTGEGDVPSPPEDDEDEVVDEKGNHPFSHFWKNTRKAPAAIVLDTFGMAFGIPDVWGASPDAIAERAAFHSGRLHADIWDDALAAVLALPRVKEAVSLHAGCRVVNAAREGDMWKIDADGGTYVARSLIVAQPPWEAANWLARALWPPHVLQVALKTKPVSAVVLSEKILDKKVDLPDVIVVPSEKVQAVRASPTELCFQATIDFELTIQAPAVVKAVKALKRARKKLLMLHPGACSEDSRIALQNVAWAQSPAQTDRRYLAKLAKKPIQSAALCFVGDAYGASYDGDQNVLWSLHGACGILTQKLAKRADALERAGATAAVDRPSATAQDAEDRAGAAVDTLPNERAPDDDRAGATLASVADEEPAANELAADDATTSEPEYKPSDGPEAPAAPESSAKLVDATIATEALIDDGAPETTLSDELTYDASDPSAPSPDFDIL